MCQRKMPISSRTSSFMPNPKESAWISTLRDANPYLNCLTEIMLEEVVQEVECNEEDTRAETEAAMVVVTAEAEVEAECQEEEVAVEAALEILSPLCSLEISIITGMKTTSSICSRTKG